MLLFFHEMNLPSSCGMFVYRDVTSAMTNRALGRRGGSFLMRLRKCFVFDDFVDFDD